MTKRFLKKREGDPFVYVYSDTLAAKRGMVECDKDGNCMRDIERPVEAPQVSDPVASNETKAELVAIARDRYGLEVTVETPVVAIIDAIETAIQMKEDAKPAIEKMTKAELIAFAKETFGVTLEDNLKVGELRAEVLQLAEQTRNTGNG